MKVRAHLLIKGRVQGVFFRSTMRDVAESSGATGWVRNLPDGNTVEAVVEGDWDAVRQVICWSLRGPPMAKVVEVNIRFEEYRGEFKEFKIVY